jgi:hypothetical protein
MFVTGGISFAEIRAFVASKLANLNVTTVAASSTRDVVFGHGNVRAVVSDCTASVTAAATKVAIEADLSALLASSGDAFNAFKAAAVSSLCAPASTITTTAVLASVSPTPSPAAGRTNTIFVDSLDEKNKIAIGLGVGLGIGIPLLLALLLISYCCCLKTAPAAASAAPSMAAATTTRDTVSYSTESYDSGDYESGSGTEESYGDEPLSSASGGGDYSEV